MKPVPIGIRGSYNLLVEPRHLANSFKDSILPPVFATPYLVLILENALYFVITPESCAAIMWRDAGNKQLAAEAMRISAPEVAAIGCVDGIIGEPPDGAVVALQRDVDGEP